MLLKFETFTITVLLVVVEVTHGQECFDPIALRASIPCCKVHPLFPLHEFVKVCDAEYVHFFKSGDRINWSNCRQMCIAEKSGAIVGETIHVEQLARYADYFNEELSRAFREAIESCARVDFKRYRVRIDDERSKCSPLAADFNTCLMTVLARTCPEDLRDESEVCQQYISGVPVCTKDD